MIQLNGFWQVFGAGMLGVVAVELLKLAAWKQTGKLTEQYSSPIYWAATLALMLVSGLAAVLSGTEQVTLLRAIQLGINAPALFAGFASASKAGRQRRQKQAQFIARVRPPSTWDKVIDLASWS